MLVQMAVATTYSRLVEMHKIWEPATKFIEKQSSISHIPAEENGWLFEFLIANFPISCFIW